MKITITTGVQFSHKYASAVTALSTARQRRLEFATHALKDLHTGSCLSSGTFLKTDFTLLN